MHRKGQAAMEFLMTYGWAILAAVVVIGVLAYFGVFSPSAYVPNQCLLSAVFGCNAASASVSEGVTLEIRHGVVGEVFNITDVIVSNCGSNTTVGNMQADTLYRITVPCTQTLTAGNKFRGDVSITYRKFQSQIDQTSGGQIIAKIGP